MSGSTPSRDDHLDEIEALCAEVSALKAALDFYGNPHHYSPAGVVRLQVRTSEIYDPDIVPDLGRVAKAALAGRNDYIAENVASSMFSAVRPRPEAVRALAYDALAAESAAWQAAAERWEAEHDALVVAHSRLAAENDALREALGFYARETTWNLAGVASRHVVRGGVFDRHFDRGAVARSALRDAGVQAWTCRTCGVEDDQWEHQCSSTPGGNQ